MIGPIYEILERKLRENSHPGEAAWNAIRNRLNPALYCPQQDPEVEVYPIDDGRKVSYLVLKYPRVFAYTRLTPEEAFLWSLMDGSHSAKDLILAYFTRFGALALGRVMGLIAHLRQNSFLVDKPIDLFERVSARLAVRRSTQWVKVVLGVLTGRLFFVRGIDPWVERFHRYGGWLLYTRPFQALYVLVWSVGGLLFIQQIRSGQFNVVQAGGSTAKALGLLFVLNYVALFIHELAHALTCRHYGAKVNGTGFLFYFGLPAFFIDTTDVWTKPLHARLATSWAGPYSGLILAGAISLLTTAFPGMPLAPSLQRLAFAWVLILLFNLIPFVEMDGYYMLVDWLEVPRLRPRALGFVRRDLWHKLRRRERFSPVERLFTWFGGISALTTVIVVVVGLSFWKARLEVVFRELWGAGLLGRLLVIPLAFVLFIPVIVSLISAVFRNARTGTQRFRRWWGQPHGPTIRSHLAVLNRVAFLAPLSDETRLEVARRLRPLRVRPGQVVFREGEEGDAFYVIRRGEAEVVRGRDGTEERLTLLGPGDHFGEIALLGQSTRTATVRSLTHLELVVLRKGDFERLLAPHLAVTEAVDRAIREAEDLRRLPLLASLPPGELAVVGAGLRRERFPAGAIVVRQGEVGTAFYIIQSGQAEAVVTIDGREQRLSLLGPGGYFGEIALLMDIPRTATVRARTPLVTLSLGRADFDALLQTILPTLTEEAATRVRTGGIIG